MKGMTLFLQFVLERCVIMMIASVCFHCCPLFKESRTILAANSLGYIKVIRLLYINDLSYLYCSY